MYLLYHFCAKRAPALPGERERNVHSVFILSDDDHLRIIGNNCPIDDECSNCSEPFETILQQCRDLVGDSARSANDTQISVRGMTPSAIANVTRFKMKQKC
jgi:hypothetical protein